MSTDMTLPPHSIEAEQSVLGALMLKPDALLDIADILTPEAFYLAKHRFIFDAIAERVNAQRPVDAVLLGDELEAAGASGIVPPVYLIELANATPSAANIRAYAEIVADRHLRRQLLGASRAIGELAVKADSGQDGIADAAKALGQIRLAQTGGLISARQVMAETYADLAARFDAKQAISGLSTGYAALDDLLGGMQEEDLIILAARPSMGKTALALNITEAVCRQGKAVAVFSLEMSRKQLGQRLLAAVGPVSLHGLRTPAHLREDEWPRVINAQAIVQGWKLAIDDTKGQTMEMLRARALRMHARQPLGLVVVDYLQLMESTSRDDNRANVVATISRGLKKLAGELKCPVIALSQLSRKCEERADKRPMLSDLRESGAIEQDADVIAFIYRDEYYNKSSADQGMAEVIVAKQRNGATDTVKLATQLQFGRFTNLPADWVAEKPKAKSSLPAQFRVEVPA